MAGKELRIGQAENYRKRALNRMTKWKHTGCEVALLAPSDHIASHPTEASCFDFSITYEDVKAFVPEFAFRCLPCQTPPRKKIKVQVLSGSEGKLT